MTDYDPRAYPPVAVTVDLVVLTIRDDRLAVLAVRRGQPPFRGGSRCPVASSGPAKGSARRRPGN